MNKYYVSYYLKDEPKDAKTFETFKEALAFYQGLNKAMNLESVSMPKAIKE
jgi:hypothetical protein